MSITIRLYGTLGRHVVGYDAREGIACAWEENASVSTLLIRLNIPLARVGMVTINGTPADRETLVPDHGQVKVFQPIFGG